jgi:peptidoglycan/LPS O-acetylase OafA/YrhL
MEKESRQILAIQMLRGVAAILVCLFHFTNGVPEFLPDNNIIKELFKFGHYGVQMFFVISGFILPYSLCKSNYRISDFGKFLMKRLIRLEPPYLVSILLVILLGYISTFSPWYKGGEFHLDLLNLTLHLGYLNAYFGQQWLSSVYWTLAIELQFYLILGLVFPYFRQFSKVFQIAIILIFLSLSILITDANLIFSYTPYFLLGIVTFLFCENRKISIVEYYAFFCLIMVVALIRVDSIGAIFGGVTALLVLFIKHSYSLFNRLGDISYSLYLVHVSIGMRIINISENFVIGTGNRLLIILLALFICILQHIGFIK